MTIPAGVDSGKILRLQEKDWRDSHGDRSDKLVRIKIVTPKHLSATERDNWKKLEQASSFDPRQQLNYALTEGLDSHDNARGEKFGDCLANDVTHFCSLWAGICIGNR